MRLITPTELAAGLSFVAARRWRRLRDPLQVLGRALRSRAGLEGDSRRLAPTPALSQGTRSAQRINQLLGITGSDDYLEVGVEFGHTFEAVGARSRVGVDPRPRFRLSELPNGVEFHAVPSDDYFDDQSSSKVFDGAFIDGLHEFRQTYRDVVAALALLKPGGFVLVDDVVPLDEGSGLPTEEEARAARSPSDGQPGAWMGDVWRVIRLLDRIHTNDLDWRTITANNRRMQTLVWKISNVLQPANEADASAVAGESYREVLGAGIPASFRAVTWPEALLAFRVGRTSSHLGH